MKAISPIDSMKPADRTSPRMRLTESRAFRNVGAGLCVLTAVFGAIQFGRWVEREKSELWQAKIESEYRERDLVSSRGPSCPLVVGNKRLARSKIDRTSVTGPVLMVCAYD